jgi:hypothetical protein
MQPKKYTIALETPAEERWLPIINDHLADIKAIYRDLEERNGGTMVAVLSKLISAASSFGYVLYKEELQSIAKVCEIPFGQLVILQLMYELSACCTSGVFYLDGIPLHIRTMDWPLPQLKKLTIEIQWTRGGQLVYQSLTWAGYIGCMTGMKAGNCSISLNYRTLGDSLTSNLKRLAQSKWPGGYLIRYVMESGMKCTDIIQHLCEAELVAPCYLIVCGDKSENCVDIVRSRSDYQLSQLDNDRLVQTNCDPFPGGQCSSNILWSFERQKMAHDVITRLQKENKEGQLSDPVSAFCQHPIINEETVYITLMIPSQSYMESQIIQ